MYEHVSIFDMTCHSVPLIELIRWKLKFKNSLKNIIKLWRKTWKKWTLTLCGFVDFLSIPSKIKHHPRNNGFYDLIRELRMGPFNHWYLRGTVLNLSILGMRFINHTFIRHIRRRTGFIMWSLPFITHTQIGMRIQVSRIYKGVAGRPLLMGVKCTS